MMLRFVKGASEVRADTTDFLLRISARILIMILIQTPLLKIAFFGYLAHGTHTIVVCKWLRSRCSLEL